MEQSKPTRQEAKRNRQSKPDTSGFRTRRAHGPSAPRKRLVVRPWQHSAPVHSEFATSSLYTSKPVQTPPPGGMNTQVHIPQKGHEHYKQEDQDSLSQEPKQLLAVHHRQRDSVADRRHMHCRGKGLTARIKSIKTVT